MVYQAFSLNEEKQKGVDKKKKPTQHRGEKLTEKLRKKGYNVLVSVIHYGVDIPKADIPKSIIVIAQSKKKQNNMLEDFCGITSELGLCFEAGNVYFKP